MLCPNGPPLLPRLSRTACALAFSLLTLLLPACMLPEKFKARIEYREDASYSYEFSGSAINAVAAWRIKRTGALTDKDRRDLEEEARKMRSNPDVKNARHTGHGRFVLESSGARESGESTFLFNFLSVVTDPLTGVTVIASNAVTEQDWSRLAALGVRMNGTLTVAVPSNAEVLTHNATSKPFMGRGAYEWKLTQLEQRPAMTLRFKQPTSAAEPADNAAPAPVALAEHRPTRILWPMFALIGWTLSILILLVIERVRAVLGGVIGANAFALGDSDDVPLQMQLINRNYMNLLQLPLLFYVACVTSYVTQTASVFTVVLAWLFVALRVAHSAIHVTCNNVKYRFALFAASNVLLMLIWLWLAAQIAAR